MSIAPPYLHKSENYSFSEMATFLLLGKWYFWVQIFNLHEILANFHVSHKEVGHITNFWLIMRLSNYAN